MVSALAGGIATGFVQGMDIRAAEESKTADRLARREDARLGREHAVTLQKANFKHAENLAKNRITADQNTAKKSNAAALFGIIAKRGAKTNAKYISVEGIPPILLGHFLEIYGGIETTETGAAGKGWILNPSVTEYNNTQKNKIMQSSHEGKLSFDLAIQTPEVLDRMVENYNATVKKVENKLDPTNPTHLAKLRTIYNHKYNTINNNTINTTAARMNQEPNQLLKAHPVQKDDGSLDPKTFLMFPKTKVAALQLANITANPDEIKKLSADPHLLNWAHLRYLNNLLKDHKAAGNHIATSPMHHVYKALVNKVKESSNKGAYFSLLATKGRWKGPHKVIEGVINNTVIDFKTNFSELHEHYFEGRNGASIRKTVNNLPNARTEADVHKWIIDNRKITGVGSEKELDAALSAGNKIVIEKVPVSDKNADAGSETSVQGSSSDPLVNNNRRVVGTPEDVVGEGGNWVKPEASMYTVTILEQVEAKTRKLSPEELNNSVNTALYFGASNGRDMATGKKKLMLHNSLTIPKNDAFIEAISLDLNMMHHRESHDRKMQNSEIFANKYNRYKDSGLYAALLKQSSDTGDSKSFRELYDIVEKTFDFESTSPVQKDKDIRKAIESALSTRFKLIARQGVPKYMSDSTGEAISFTPTMQYKAPSDKIVNELSSQSNKIAITTKQVESLEDTIGKLGFASILENLQKVKSGGAKDVLNDAYTLILGDRRFSLDDPAVQKALGITEPNAELLARVKKGIMTEGMVQSAEMIQKTNIVFQTISDILTTGKKVIGRWSSDKLFTRPEALVGDSSLTSRAFRSKHDTARDGMTRSRLKQIEQLRGKTKLDYEKNMATLKGQLDKLTEAATPWDKLTPDQKSERLAIQAKMAGEFLKAKQTALKISLTYYFAGLVQGESGGRAISNEDFAILFRALWAGGVGGPMIKGGFGVIKEVMGSLKERNEMLTEYLGWGKGTQLADKMIGLRRASEEHSYDRGPKSALYRRLRAEVRAEKNIAGMPGSASYIQGELDDLKTVSPPQRAAAGIPKGEKYSAYIGHYNSVMGPIIKGRNIGPKDRAKQSIGSFTAKSWKDVNDSSKIMIKKGIANSIYAQMSKESKEGKTAMTKTVLDALHYTKGDMGVGSAIDLLRSLATGTVTRPGKDIAAKADQASKILDLYIEEIYNGSRR